MRSTLLLNSEIARKEERRQHRAEAEGRETYSEGRKTSGTPGETPEDIRETTKGQQEDQRTTRRRAGEDWENQKDIRRKKKKKKTR